MQSVYFELVVLNPNFFSSDEKTTTTTKTKKSLYKEQTFAPGVFHSVSVRTLTERDKQTQAIRDAQKDQHWRHSLQSITRPFQQRFREVFGNARILIFYLSIKAWEQKSLPRSHLGWFFLVFGEGKARKENMSIFWFIWPLISKIAMVGCCKLSLYTNGSCDEHAICFRRWLKWRSV